jgi:hypothetical protein
LAYSRLTPHLKDKLESHVFSDVSQVLQRALNCESRAKQSRRFHRTSDKPRNERHVNRVEYSSEPLDDEEAEMCVVECGWGSKSKPFTLKADKMKCATHLTSLSVIGFLTTCCRKSKLNCQVVTSYRRRNSSKSMHIVNGIILILLLLTIAMFSVDRFNQP